MHNMSALKRVLVLKNQVVIKRWIYFRYSNLFPR